MTEMSSDYFAPTAIKRVGYDGDAGGPFVIDAEK